MKVTLTKPDGTTAKVAGSRAGVTEMLRELGFGAAPAWYPWTLTSTGAYWDSQPQFLSAFDTPD